MVNEIISWASKRKKQLFLLKVDFEKAFDSLDWGFLDNVMKHMGFSQKWRKWINRCLDSAYSSVLVNETLIKEFKIEKGLRQDDPLSPFLFIIAMEALHVTLEDEKLKNILEGSIDNAKNLCRILRCFHLASDLKVNFLKSKLFGIGVLDVELNTFSYTLFCEPLKLPCMYLGLMIGTNMIKSNNWKPIIHKFHNHLTSWKAKYLLPRGRLTLLKSVLGALGTYYFSIFQALKCVFNYLEQLIHNFFWGGTMENNKIAWITWKKVCSELKFRGLGIGSLNSSDISMLVKWWWQLYMDRNALWFQMIVSIHGLYGGIDLEETSLNRLPLTTFARLYSLESNKQCLINERCSLLNGSIHFTWAWRRNLRPRQELDQLDTLMGLLQHHCPSPIDDRWDFTLHHCNMYSMEQISPDQDQHPCIAINDRLPTRSILDSHDIDLHSLLCSVYDDSVNLLNIYFTLQFGF
ncbi:putative RNA-directed DNA polymerase, eukaryota, reverse transcriptase zinc-binding domain protein [Tanacetum coccineum]|uniref:RNA-directed DNA polymerase, eukaryota, reverse transcriptase zinc-binding domain protein n=1 Tax=Tanacetum coccineum TaxID=301880 RepID=A0ABQ4ZN26_9ASTR